jgi:hypothetical protein
MEEFYMGFFDKFLIKTVPGGPVSLAKAVLRAFNRFKEYNPFASKDEALRYAIESRCQIIKVMNLDEIEYGLEKNKNLCDLVLYIIEKENPATFDLFEEKTIKELYSFFKKHLSSELSGSLLEGTMFLISIQEGILKAGSSGIWQHISEGKEEYYDIECRRCGQHIKIEEPLNSGTYRCSKCDINLDYAGGKDRNYHNYMI